MMIKRAGKLQLLTKCGGMKIFFAQSLFFVCLPVIAIWATDPTVDHAIQEAVTQYPPGDYEHVSVKSDT